MIKREGYTKRMERNLDGWLRRFEARRAAAAGAGAAVSSETREQLEASKVSGEAAVAKLRELRAAAGRYLELRGEMDALWKAIDDAPADGVDEPAAEPSRKRRTSVA